MAISDQLNDLSLSQGLCSIKLTVSTAEVIWCHMEWKC